MSSLFCTRPDGGPFGHLERKEQHKRRLQILVLIAFLHKAVGIPLLAKEAASVPAPLFACGESEGLGGTNAGFQEPLLSSCCRRQLLFPANTSALACFGSLLLVDGEGDMDSRIPHFPANTVPTHLGIQLLQWLSSDMIGQPGCLQNYLQAEFGTDVVNSRLVVQT